MLDRGKDPSLIFRDHATEPATMAAVHSRTLSATDRRSASNGAGIARTASLHARDYDNPYIRGDGSPIPPEDVSNGSVPGRGYDKSDRRSNETERRTEKSRITVREKIIRTKSPVKEPSTTASRRELDKGKRGVVDPASRTKAKEFETGMHS